MNKNTMGVRAAPVAHKEATLHLGRVNRTEEVTKAVGEAFQFQIASNYWLQTVLKIKIWLTINTNANNYLKDYLWDLNQKATLWILVAFTMYQILTLNNNYFSARRKRENYRTQWSIVIVALILKYTLVTKEEAEKPNIQLQAVLTNHSYKINTSTKETRLILESVEILTTLLLKKKLHGKSVKNFCLTLLRTAGYTCMKHLLLYSTKSLQLLSLYFSVQLL